MVTTPNPLFSNKFGFMEFGYITFSYESNEEVQALVAQGAFTSQLSLTEKQETETQTSTTSGSEPAFTDSG